MQLQTEQCMTTHRVWRSKHRQLQGDMAGSYNFSVDRLAGKAFFVLHFGDPISPPGRPKTHNFGHAG